jgi:hypothetical protein
LKDKTLKTYKPSGIEKRVKAKYSYLAISFSFSYFSQLINFSAAGITKSRI